MKNGPYILLKAPDKYPGKKYRGKYAYEHQIIFWLNTGIIPPKGYHVHHKNEIKTDNRFDNLEIISRSTHTYTHKKIGTDTVALTCNHCNKPFIREKRNYTYRKDNGQTRFYCCRSHQVTDQQKRIKEKKLNHNNLC